MKRFTTLLLLVMCIASGWTLVAAISMVNHPTPPDDAIGHLNHDAPPTVYADKLVDELAGDDDSTSFEIVKWSGDWQLLRRGIQQGSKHTEVIPCTLAGGYFRLDVPVVCEL